MNPNSTVWKLLVALAALTACPDDARAKQITTYAPVGDPTYSYQPPFGIKVCKQTYTCTTTILPDDLRAATTYHLQVGPNTPVDWPPPTVTVQDALNQPLTINGTPVVFELDACASTGTCVVDARYPAEVGRKWVPFITTALFTNGPIPVPETNSTLTFSVTYQWPNEVLGFEGATLASWVSDDGAIPEQTEVVDFYGTGTVRTVPTIPTLSQWGLIILSLLLLTIGTVFILRRPALVAAGTAS